MNLEYLENIYFKSIKDKNIQTDQAIADTYLNISYKEVFLAHNWIYRKRSGQLVLIPRYTTGTCAVTQFDSTNEASAKTITFTGSTLTTGMVGRYIRFSGGDQWYKIVYLTGSGTSWTGYLDSPITDVSGGSLSFEIWKRFYYIKSDAAELLDFGRWSNGRLEYNPDLIDRYTDISKESDTPSSFNAYGVDQFADITDSATIAITANTNVGTVSGINMLSSGYDTGDVVQISGSDYYINRIESDSKVVLFNYFDEALVAGTSITLRKSNPIGFEFYNPTDTYQTLPYDYLGRAYDLVHRTRDRILVPNNFIPAIIARAQYFSMKDADDKRYIEMLRIYNAEMTTLREKVHVVQPRYMQFVPKIHALSPGRS